MPRPVMEVTTHATQTLVRIGHGKMGSLESLPRIKHVVGCLWIDTRKDLMQPAVWRIDPNLIVATPTKCQTNGPAPTLIRLSVE